MSGVCSGLLAGDVVEMVASTRASLRVDLAQTLRGSVAEHALTSYQRHTRNVSAKFQFAANAGMRLAQRAGMRRPAYVPA